MNKSTIMAILIAVFAVLGIGNAWSHLPQNEYAMAQHEDHDKHGETEPGNDEDGQDEHEHEDPQETDHHDDESVVQLSPEERSKLGVVVSTADSGNLTTQIRLPGELVLNADRVAHIVPRAPGIVREVLASIGDTVHAGEVMAWIESAALGEAKVDYLAKWAALGSSSVDLVRAREVHHNTTRLLEVLDLSPSLETLRETEVGVMGENRSILVSAYAEFVFARSAYLRERPLFEKKIASERDFQAAEAEYKKADALYAATRDSIEFKIRRDLLETERTQQVREIELQGARRHLYLLGLTSEEITKLERLAELQMRVSARTAMCNDPLCKTCRQAASNGIDGITDETDQRETERKLAWYPLRAPFNATVIEKHLALGEKHSDESGAFTVADLTSVWVNIAVYQKDLPYVSKGMTVAISAGSGMPHAQGTIVYVAPVVDHKTRTALARVVLPNKSGQLRPGLFVNARISMGQESVSIVIPKSAVQRMGEESVVFLETTEGYVPVPVSLGRSDGSRVEVLSGLIAGQRFVTKGAFELKAKLVTSGLDAHAGHGH